MHHCGFGAILNYSLAEIIESALVLDLTKCEFVEPIQISQLIYNLVFPNYNLSGYGASPNLNQEFYYVGA